MTGALWYPIIKHDIILRLIDVLPNKSKSSSIWIASECRGRAAIMDDDGKVLALSFQAPLGQNILKMGERFILQSLSALALQSSIDNGYTDNNYFGHGCKGVEPRGSVIPQMLNFARGQPSTRT